MHFSHVNTENLALHQGNNIPPLMIFFMLIARLLNRESRSLVEINKRIWKVVLECILVIM